MTDLKPGDRVEVLHGGSPTGRFGTVINVSTGITGAVYVEAQVDDDLPPAFDLQDCFQRLEFRHD